MNDRDKKLKAHFKRSKALEQNTEGQYHLTKTCDRAAMQLEMKILGYRVKLQQEDEPALLGAQLHRARLLRTGPILDAGHGWELSFPIHMETTELLQFEETDWNQ